MLSRELLVDGFSACHQSPLLGSPLLLLPGLSPWLSRGGQAVPGECGSQRGTLLPALRSLLLMLLLLSILWSPPSFLFLTVYLHLSPQALPSPFLFLLSIFSLVYLLLFSVISLFGGKRHSRDTEQEGKEISKCLTSRNWSIHRRKNSFLNVNRFHESNQK